MARYLLARLIAIIPTVLLLLAFVVVLVRLLPGDVVDIKTEGTGATNKQKAALRKELGLDRNLVSEYVHYTGQVFRGDLGRSLVSSKSVGSEIKSRAGVSVELTVLALVIAVLIGIPVGILSAISPNSPIDYILRSISIAGLSLPSFVLATMVVVLPTIWWGWSPSLIYKPLSAGLVKHVTQFIAPALVLGFAFSASLMRLTRTSMLEVLRMDFVRTARAKGLRGTTIIWRHALRNALIPVLTLLGTQVGILLSGAILVETVFSLPGIGQSLLGAVTSRDYPVVQGLTVITGLAVIFVNLGVDLSYAFIDPRVQ